MAVARCCWLLSLAWPLIGAGCGGGTTIAGAGATDGAAPDGIAGAACNGPAASTLDSVRFEFVDDSCTYSLAEAAAGLTINYRLVVETDQINLHPTSQDLGYCARPNEQTGLIVDFKIEGQGQSYCWCDVGSCPYLLYITAARAGTYSGAVLWDGVNWNGPSDTNNPKGAPFPPGRYSLTLLAQGKHDNGNKPQPFQVTAVRYITLTGPAPGP